jgi:flagella basal body P-ring formation protein FlgA
VKVRPRLPLAPTLRLLAAACALAPLAPAQSAAAAGVGPEVLAQAMQLVAQAAQTLAPPRARIVALPGVLDSRLSLAPCEQVQPFLPAGVPPWGRSRVGLRCTKGPVAWQVYLPLTVQVWAPAPVAGATLPAGARLDATQLGLAEVDWAASTSAPAATAAELQDRVLVRPVAAGQPVRAADLKARLWFAQGDTVRVEAQSTGFAISTEGQALGPGIEGQRVRVRTESGRVLSGLPVGQRRVELSL